MARTPYEILGVSKSASQDEIKKSYRKLAKTLHPDLNPGNKEMEHRFKEVTGAYDTLGDPKKRAEYDAQAANPFGGQEQQGTGQGRSGPFYYETQGDGSRYSSQFDEDFFSSVFGAASGRRGRSGAARGHAMDLPGEDEHYQLEVDLRDAVVGAERELTLPRGKRLRVKIPSGVESGTKLRFAGMGQPGIGRGTPGDVYVEIRVRPSTQFQIKGQDLESELPISLPEALFGGEVRAPTVDGHVMLKIPAGVNTGARLRIKGKGLVDRSLGKRGDQVVVLKIMLPHEIDAELKEAIREWSSSHPYNPREENPNAA